MGRGKIGAVAPPGAAVLITIPAQVRVSDPVAEPLSVCPNEAENDIAERAGLAECHRAVALNR